MNGLSDLQNEGPIDPTKSIINIPIEILQVRKMIYANEYGTVDLLSEQFLQSLKSDNGTIGVKLSGGADTALLLYLLAKEISERNLNFSIVPYTFNDKPDRFIVAQNIIHEVAKTFPKVKFEKQV